MELYVIHNEEDSAYLHFNPATGEYFPSTKLNGACIFTRDKGSQLLKEGGLSVAWTLQRISGDYTIVSDSRSNEVKYYDVKH